MKKRTKIIISTVLVFIVLAIAGIFLGALYLYNFALNPKNMKDVFTKDSTAVSRSETSGKAKENPDWLKENSTEEYMNSNDGLKLHAYQVQQKKKSDLYAVIVHGYKGNGLKMSSYAKRFYDMGFNLVVPDLRAHGKSEGNYIGMGWHDRLDVLKWTNSIIEKNENAKVVLFGVSMGAATVMMASGEKMPQQVKAIIEDCGYTSVEAEFKKELKTAFNLPSFPLLNAASLITDIKAGYNFKEASAINQVKKLKKPALFIHGDKDTFVPFSMLDEVYNAASCEKEKLVVKGAGHAKSSSVDPDLYWGTIKNFLNKHVTNN